MRFSQSLTTVSIFTSLITFSQASFADGLTDLNQALAKLTPELLARHQAGELVLPLQWTVKNRMVKGEPSFTIKVVEGESNTHSEISLIDIKDDVGLFKLSPITGRTHQLRVHMQSLGMSIINDRCYPQLQPKADDDYARPLKLVAKRLKFNDPVTGIALDIESVKASTHFQSSRVKPYKISQTCFCYG